MLQIFWSLNQKKFIIQVPSNDKLFKVTLKSNDDDDDNNNINKSTWK